jgi:hypothetical protein
VAGSYPNLTPLRVGMSGLLGGKEYRIAARTVFSMTEEGETSYWHEFELVAPDGSLLYLEHDEGEWKLFEPFMPMQPLTVDVVHGLGVGSKLILDGRGHQVTERGVATVRFVEGVPSQPPAAGEQRHYLEAGFGSQQVSVEWHGHEIELYRARPLALRQVLTFFGLREEIRALDALEKKRNSQKLFAAFCLVLSISAFIGWGASVSSGDVVSSGTAMVGEIGRDGKRFGPVRLDPNKRVHRLVIRGSMRESSAWVQGVVEEDLGLELFGAEGDFWDESGYDSDGYWHESYLRSHRDFVARRPGPYYIRLYAESGSPLTTQQSVGYELREGVIYPTYLALFAFFALGVSLLFFIVGSQEGLAKMSKSSA